MKWLCHNFFILLQNPEFSFLARCFIVERFESLIRIKAGIETMQLTKAEYGLTVRLLS